MKYGGFEIILVPEDNGRQYSAMAINFYVLMISLVTLSACIQVNMLCYNFINSMIGDINTLVM